MRLNAEKLAYLIEPGAAGRDQLVERPLADLMCLSLPSFGAALVVGNVDRWFPHCLRAYRLDAEFLGLHAGLRGHGEGREY